MGFVGWVSMLVVQSALAQAPDAGLPNLDELTPDGVHVRLEASEPAARLEVVPVSPDAEPTVVCQAPCLMLVPDPSATFRIAGENITPSAHFTLVDHDEAVLLKATCGSQRQRTAGKALLITGVVLSVLGAGSAITSLSLDKFAGTSTEPLAIGGISGLVVGLAASLTGMLLQSFNDTLVQLLTDESFVHPEGG